MNRILALLILVAPVQDGKGDPEPGTLSVEEAEATLTAAEVKQHIGFLASDEMKGRDTGSPELEKAAAYVTAEFKRLGFKGVGDNGGYTKAWDYRKKSVPNCLGLLEGSDPKLKDEVLVIGGHMDHIGVQGREVMNGADDNASGTTGVLELAEAFASLKVRPKRSILFMTFSGEEKGLLGSAAYCKDPAIPHGRCVAMINLDMIGRSTDDYLFIGGLGTSAALPEIIKKATEGSGFELETSEGGLAPSDNTNFHKAGLPVLFFFTHIHPDYHGADDTVDKIAAEAEARILRIVFRVARDITERPERLPFTQNNDQALPKDFMDRMKGRFGGDGPKRRKVRLGVVTDDTADGLRVKEVVEDQPAHAAGVRAGDVIVSINGQKVSTLAELQPLLKEFKPGDKVPLVIRREGKEQTLEVVFPKP